MRETDILRISSKIRPKNYTYGEKGLKLFESKHKGFNVPDGILLSVQFLERFVESMNAGDKIREIIRLEMENSSGLDVIVREYLKACNKDEKILSEITDELKLIEDFDQSALFAVRSAAIGEDAASSSFAGQYETVLNNSIKDIWEAIIICYSSWWSDRIVTYRRQNKIEVTTPQISVIIQLQVVPDFAGVLFTKDPRNAGDLMIIEAVRGLGDKLVSGQVIPARWELTHKKNLEIASYPSDGHEAASINDEMVYTLAKMGSNLVRQFSTDLDIEWAISKQKIYLLQLRPITTFRKNEDLIALTKNMYCRTIVEDLWSDRMTNITSSIIFEEFSDLYTFKTPLRKLKLNDLAAIPSIKVIRGYGYLNVEVVARLLELLPGALRFREIRSSFPEDIRNQVLQVKPKANLIIKIIPRAPLLLNDLAVLPFLTTPLLKKHLKKITEQLNKYEDYDHKELFFYKVELSRLLGLLAKMQIRNQWGYGNASVMTWLTYHLCTRFLSKDEQWVLGHLRNIPDNVTLLIQKRLIEICSRIDSELIENVFSLKSKEAAWQILNTKYPDHPVTQGLKEVIRDYKFRSTNRDFIHPRWDEKPSNVVEHLGLLLKSDFASTETAQKSETVRSSFGEKLISFILSPLFSNTKKLLALREDLRFGLDISFYRIRRLLLSIMKLDQFKELKDIPGWIFFLEVNELRLLLNEPEKWSDLIPKIKDRMRIYSAEKDTSPPYYVFDDGMSFFDLRVSGERAFTFRGIPASPGIAEGPAKIVRNEEDFNKLEHGDILIAYNTDPGWTPLFLLARAVVVEMGGILNHCAIVAREYGVPAVVGVMQITSIITDNQIIRVNGHTGTIEILHSPK